MTTETPGHIRSLPLKYHVEVLTPEQVRRIHGIALRILQRTGPAGHFLAQPHTRRHMSEFWRARYMDRASWEEWRAAGAPDPSDVALTEVRRLLAEHEPEPLEDAAAQELSRIVAAYEAEALEHTKSG